VSTLPMVPSLPEWVDAPRSPAARQFSTQMDDEPEPARVVRTPALRRWGIAGAAVLAMCVAGGLLLSSRGNDAAIRTLAPAPAPVRAITVTPPAALVHVELRGLPADARVQVDGTQQNGPMLTFARGPDARHIEITVG